MELVHRFGLFEVHPTQRQLLVDGQPTPIGARAFDVLPTLISRLRAAGIGGVLNV